MNLRRVDLGLRSETVRRSNLSAIAHELHAAGHISRSELGARTGLTRSAIRALTGEFIAAGLVAEERAAPIGTPGRPSALVRTQPEQAFVLALDIAVDSMAAATVGFGRQTLDSRRIDRPRGHVSVDETVDTLVGLARGIDALGPGQPKLLGVGVAVVGVVRQADGFVSIVPNLGWHDVPLGRRLAAALAVDVPISIANEADLGALSEHQRGAARGAANALFLSGEVGVGGGIIADGRRLTGAGGFAGEVGHMPVNPNGSVCRCGSVGCWETEIGEDALLRRAGQPAGGGRDGVDAVLRAAQDGSAQARQALDEVGHALGVGLAGLVNLLNPELVVLGGFLGRIHPLVSDIVSLELDRLALAAPRSQVTVVPAALGADAPLLGAAELAFEPFLNDPAAWLPRDTLARELLEAAAAARQSAPSSRAVTASDHREEPLVAAAGSSPKSSSGR
jgi:predicted NBD/HSP70 family sugar kinase